MGLLGKVIGLTAAAAGGIAVTAGLIGSKDKRLLALEKEFQETTRIYEQEKATLTTKVNRGSRGAKRKLIELEKNYSEAKTTYESKRNKLLPKKENEREQKEAYAAEQAEIAKKATERERETMALAHQMEMERLERLHLMKVEELHLQTQSVSQNETEVPLQNKEFVFCRDCGNKISSDAKFCSACGSLISNTCFCKNCGAKLKSDSKFCSMCGAATKQEIT